MAWPWLLPFGLFFVASVAQAAVVEHTFNVIHMRIYSFSFLLHISFVGVAMHIYSICLITIVSSVMQAPCMYVCVCVYIYRKIIFYSQRVVTPICISLDLGRIWPDEVYIDGVYHHIRPSKVLCMTSIYVYLEYIVIIILYVTIIVLYNILKSRCSFEFFLRSKDLEYLNISMWTYLN